MQTEDCRNCTQGQRKRAVHTKISSTAASLTRGYSGSLAGIKARACHCSCGHWVLGLLRPLQTSQRRKAHRRVPVHHGNRAHACSRSSRHCRIRGIRHAGAEKARQYYVSLGVLKTCLVVLAAEECEALDTAAGCAPCTMNGLPQGQNTTQMCLRLMPYVRVSRMFTRSSSFGCPV